jgi:hypothetical protein
VKPELEAFEQTRRSFGALLAFAPFAETRAR